MNKLNLYGTVSSKGKLAPFGKERLEEFLNINREKRIFMSFLCIEPDSTEHHVWYIMKMVVPAFIEGYKNNGVTIDPEEAVQEIIDCCPFFVKNDQERHNLFNFIKYAPYTEMQRDDLELAIEWLHYYCLENFNIVIGIHKSL